MTRQTTRQTENHLSESKVLHDPARYFKKPMDVINHPALSNHQKKKILDTWAFDAKEREVAEEENMHMADKHVKVTLADVLAALAVLKSNVH